MKLKKGEKQKIGGLLEIVNHEWDHDCRCSYGDYCPSCSHAWDELKKLGVNHNHFT